MVTRSYTPPEIAVRDTREATQQQVAGSDNRAAIPLVVGDNSWRDSLINSLGGQANRLLNQHIDAELANEYLEGASQVGILESEEELEGNILTRDWKVAGFRDTSGKLALAESNAKFMADLPMLREQAPEKFNEYLVERRNRILPGLAGMSRAAREATTGQMLLQDKSDTRRYTTERTKFIIEQKAQAVHSQWSTQVAGMQAAQMQVATQDMTPEDFGEQLRTATGVMVGSVWMDPSLPVNVKRDLTTDMVQSALASDNVALYEYLAANPIKDEEGPASTLLSRLDGDQQVKLTNQYREAMGRTRDRRNIERMAEVANLRAQIDTGRYTDTQEELEELTGRWVLNGTISGETRTALLEKALEQNLKRETNSALGEALLRGDIDAIRSMGKDVPDAIDAWQTTMNRRGDPAADQLNTWLAVGQQGIDQGFKKAGEILQQSLHQIIQSKDGTVLPQHSNVFRLINKVAREAEGPGLTNTRTSILSGLAQDDRMFAEQIFRKVDEGGSLDEAIMNARELLARDSALTPSARAARAQSVQADILKGVMQLDSRGLLSTVWSYAKGIFSTEALDDVTLSPMSRMSTRDGWLGDSPTVQFATESVRQELLNEADHVSIMRPSASASEVLSVAKANLAARTISTRQMPLIMPRNVDLEQVFGVGPGNQAAIGRAIDGVLHRTSSDGRFQLRFEQGKLFAQEFDRNGQRVGTGMYIEPRSIQARIKYDIQKDRNKANEQFGLGKTVTQGDSSVTFNGLSPAGVPTGWVLGFRQNLVDHEGVRSTPYKDASGRKDAKGNDIMTGGVGVSSHNPRYPKVGADGKISQADINKSFAEASSDAALVGARLSRSLGRDNMAGFQLMSELAYQSGPAFMERKDKVGDVYRDFAQALQGSDAALAKQKFMATAAWFHSRDRDNPTKPTRRQRKYLELIDKSMKG